MSRFLWKLGGARIPLLTKREDIPPVAEVAHSLSIINRFTGWTIYPYPVAQHAVFTSYLVEPEFALHALHHDDHECVAGDISSPMKREMDSDVLARICDLFDGHSPWCADWSAKAKRVVKRADLLATYFEAIYLVEVPREEVEEHFGFQGLNSSEVKRLEELCRRLSLDEESGEALVYALREMNWGAAKSLYIERHNELLGG